MTDTNPESTRSRSPLRSRTAVKSGDAAAPAAGSTSADEAKTLQRPARVYNDRLSLAILSVLYTLQGVPMGLAATIPMLLAVRKASLSDQAIFSFVSWPFAVKLLYAPLVDALYVRADSRWGRMLRLGRRKSWLVPVQLLTALMLCVFSGSVDVLLGPEPPAAAAAAAGAASNATAAASSLDAAAAPAAGADSAAGAAGAATATAAVISAAPNVPALTAIFFCLFALMSLQDIAVDGLSLTMLSPARVSLAPTVNSAGQTLGYISANIGFLALNSADFCNRFRSQPLPYGWLSLSQFMVICGWVFLAVTLLVWALQPETDEEETAASDSDKAGERRRGCLWTVADAYRQMWRIMRLPSVLSLAVVLLTSRLAFGAADGVTSLKILGKGVPKDSMVALGAALTPVAFLLPVLLAKFTSGPRPMDMILFAKPLRLLIGVWYAVFFYWTPDLLAPAAAGEPAPALQPWYWPVATASAVVAMALSTASFVAGMCFFALISDPAMGGTYMTLLNTLYNLGGMASTTLALKLTDLLTRTQCSLNGAAMLDAAGAVAECGTTPLREQCTAAGGHCQTTVDGYYILIAANTLFGLGWLYFMSPRVHRLQSLPVDAWRISAPAARKDDCSNNGSNGSCAESSGELAASASHRNGSASVDANGSSAAAGSASSLPAAPAVAATSVQQQQQQQPAPTPARRPARRRSSSSASLDAAAQTASGAGAAGSAAAADSDGAASAASATPSGRARRSTTEAGTRASRSLHAQQQLRRSESKVGDA